MLHLVWLVPVLPLLGVAINGIFGRWTRERAHLLGVGTTGLSLLIAFGIFLSYVVVVEGFGVPVAYYRNHTLASTNMEDVSIGMIKGFVFGILIVIISCHQGLHASNGAVGVGRSTTEAMVVSALWVLIVNFFLSLLLNIVFPYGSAA